MKQIHYISGITLSVFIGLHLLNHLTAVFGADTYIKVMEILRLFYRNPAVETLIIASVVIQIVSGILLLRKFRFTKVGLFEKVHLATGLYLAIFLIFHLSAIFLARGILKIDTNFYFGAAGLNIFPFNLFFIPYYSLAVISVFVHIATVHRKKETKKLTIVFIFGLCLSVLIIFGLTNHFKGVTLPTELLQLAGK